MAAVERIKSVVSRIRWKSVFAVVLLVALAAVAFKWLPAGYQTGGGLGLRVSANPPKVAPGGLTTLEAELKNLDSDRSVKVLVKARTYDAELVFEETYGQEYDGLPISIGPQGARKITFKINSKPTALEGKYPVDVTAAEEGGGEGAAKRIFLTIEKKG